jgi:ligand-binding SRPBCC domain-containing protein
MYYELTDHFVVAASPERTWDFFSSAENLPKITPPGLRFTITTPRPITIAADARLDYTIRWAGLPIRWRTRIVDWEPLTRFTDLQVRGPYALWHHTHTFTPVADGVECTDKVIYRVPVPGVGRVVHALAVKRQLMAIFRFRREVIGRELGWVRAVQEDVRIRAIG